MHPMHNQPGNKVRLVLEGTIVDPGPDGWVVAQGGALIQLPDGNKHIALVKDLELLEDLQVGDIVQDADGFTYRRTTGGMWLEFGSGDVCPDSEAVRPLTLLVRDGKPVAAK